MTARVPLMLLCTCALIALTTVWRAPSALGSAGQVAMFEDDTDLYKAPATTLASLRALGVRVVRVSVQWNQVTRSGFARRRPASLRASDPASSGYDFSALDRVVTAAQGTGIVIDLSLTGGAPLWATGSHKPPGGRYPQWEPTAAQYGLFVQAVATRYSGNFAPSSGAARLPAVRFWEIWNEPNYGQDLGPQATHMSSVPASPAIYRGLLDAAWSALMRTGHGHDTVVIGNLAARGLSARGHGHFLGLPGNFGPTKPLSFLRTLYCVDSRFRPLRGAFAAAVGCPTSAAGSRGFRGAHPALFAAAGFGVHPYSLTGFPPNRADSRDPDFAEFSELPHLVSALDRASRAYHSGHRFSLYNTEYGYITNPPRHIPGYPSPSQAAVYLNWAEYTSWRSPRIASTMQFLLTDPFPHSGAGAGGFATGLYFFGGKPKPTLDAYILPIWVPQSTVRRGHRLLVWGCARPAAAYGNPRVTIEFQAHGRGAFRAEAGVSITNPRGYFQAGVGAPTSGALRLTWAYPGGQVVHSRTVNITVR